MRKSIQSLLAIVGLSFLAFACSKADSEGPVPFRTYQVEQMLSNGDAKLWLLTGRSIDGEEQEPDSCSASEALFFDLNALIRSDSNVMVMGTIDSLCTEPASTAWLFGQFAAVEGEITGVDIPNADTLEWYLYRIDNDTVLTPFRDTLEVYLESITGQTLTILYDEPLTDSTTQRIRANYEALEY